MSLNLNLNWTPAIPTPTCGYRATYRRNLDDTYTQVETSGSSLAILVPAPACYEGLVTSDCCSESVSPGIPYGVNAYNPFHVDIVVDPDTFNVVVTITSAYANSYDEIMNIDYDLVTGSGTTTQSITIGYPAGSTTFSAPVQAASDGDTIENIVVTGHTPDFDNGGALQQADPVSTPPYFEFYWDADGVPTPLSPISVPSFLVQQFDVTEQDNQGNALAGNLHVSFILSGSDFDALFDSITLQVSDGKFGTNGAVSVQIAPNGLRSAIIPLVKVENALDDSTEFTMKAIWPDLSIADSALFFFP